MIGGLCLLGAVGAALLHLTISHYMHESLSFLSQLIRAEEVDIFGFQEVRLDVGQVEWETECQVCQLSRYLPEYQVCVC